MVDKLMVDSTILIDYFRKTDKRNSQLVNHFKNYDILYISSVTSSSKFKISRITKEAADVVCSC